MLEKPLRYVIWLLSCESQFSHVLSKHQNCNGRLIVTRMDENLAHNCHKSLFSLMSLAYFSESEKCANDWHFNLFFFFYLPKFLNLSITTTLSLNGYKDTNVEIVRVVVFDGFPSPCCISQTWVGGSWSYPTPPPPVVKITGEKQAFHPLVSWHFKWLSTSMLNSFAPKCRSCRTRLHTCKHCWKKQVYLMRT